MGGVWLYNRLHAMAGVADGVCQCSGSALFTQVAIAQFSSAACIGIAWTILDTKARAGVTGTAQSAQGWQ